MTRYRDTEECELAVFLVNDIRVGLQTRELAREHFNTEKMIDALTTHIDALLADLKALQKEEPK